MGQVGAIAYHEDVLDPAPPAIRAMAKRWNYFSFPVNPTRKRNRGQITIPAMDEKGAVRSRLEMSQRLILKEHMACNSRQLLKCQGGFKWPGTPDRRPTTVQAYIGRDFGGCTPSLIRGCAARLDRVWFFPSLSYTGHIISRESVSNYKMAIASTIDLICLMTFVCTPRVQKH